MIHESAQADMASLPNQVIKSGDLIQIWRNGTAYAVNWNDFSRYEVTGVNWNGLPVAGTGAYSWTANSYIGQ